MSVTCGGETFSCGQEDDEITCDGVDDSSDDEDESEDEDEVEENHSDGWSNE